MLFLFFFYSEKWNKSRSAIKGKAECRNHKKRLSHEQEKEIKKLKKCNKFAKDQSFTKLGAL